jgi:RNA polymerase sigma-70 factor (ECF subfamily)
MEEVSVEERETDAALIIASISDPKAFERLFARHVEAIFGYFARRLGEDPAEDLTADVFLKAFDKRSHYDCGYPDARPWLYGIAANLLRRHHRAEDRRLRASRATRCARGRSATSGSPR